MRWIVFRISDDPEACEIRGASRCQVAPGHRCATALHQLGQGAHARTGDAHEMNWARIATGE
jgi:hypothetical protein